ncbi:MAG: anthrone oxygenase family protein [Steroidobacteraceae bacterium]
MSLALLIVASVGAGIVGGVFFAFSTFVMKALASVPAAAGIATMQRINVVVLNSLFLGAFVGTAAVSAVVIAAAFFPWTTPRSLVLLAAGSLYLFGCFFITLAFNVPRNNRLARLKADSAEALEYWPIYVREWQFWNHVRGAASVASAACSAAALAV